MVAPLSNRNITISIKNNPSFILSFHNHSERKEFPTFPLISDVQKSRNAISLQTTISWRELFMQLFAVKTLYWYVLQTPLKAPMELRTTTGRKPMRRPSRKFSFSSWMKPWLKFIYSWMMMKNTPRCYGMNWREFSLYQAPNLWEPFTQNWKTSSAFGRYKLGWSCIHIYVINRRTCRYGPAFHRSR